MSTIYKQAPCGCILIMFELESHPFESLSQFVDMRDCNILTFPPAKLLSNKTILALCCQFIMRNYFSFASSLDETNGRQLHQKASQKNVAKQIPGTFTPLHS